jgi:hypothetical protein
MNRTARMSLWSVLVIGALFIVMPFAISLPSKASAGQNMLNGFHPLMQPVAVKSAANYYYQDFVPLGPVFEKVPAGLALYQPLIETMQAQVNNYAKVDSLPNFNLFTWFFVLPGLLLVLLSVVGLFFGRREDQFSSPSIAPSSRESSDTNKVPELVS